MKNCSYDFLGSIYEKTTEEEIKICFESLSNQTVKPYRVILVIDGPIFIDIDKILEEFIKYLKIKVIKLKENIGLGLALRKGLEYCSSKYILRFDSDDFNIPTRAEEQLIFMETKNLDISSSSVFEFIDIPKNKVSVKYLPLKQSSIKRMLPFRNPFNHPSICFKFDSIKKLDGGYRNFPYYEDYDLWIRALSMDLRCENLKKILVGMKINTQIDRRKGISKILLEAKLFNTFLKYSPENILFFSIAFSLRTILNLFPKNIVVFFYKNLLRKSLK